MAKIKICLDAGHYGKYNHSAVVPAYYESDFNWKFHLLLKKYLEQNGMEVITTRATQAKDMDLYDRGRCAKGCDMFLSIHANWAARPDADYVVCYVPINGSGDKLGMDIAKCVCDIMGTREYPRVNTKKSSNGKYNWYGVIHGADQVGVPGIIIEHSFYSNKEMATWMMDDDNLDRMARAEANVIARYYNLAVKVEERPIANPAPAPTPAPSVAKNYCAISGAYTVQKNADIKLETVRKTYPDAIMIKSGIYYKILVEAFATSAEANKKVTEIKSKGLDAYVSNEKSYTVIVNKPVVVTPAPSAPAPVTPVYTQKMFVEDIQRAIGAKVDGIAGPETLSKTVTVSRWTNRKHAVVKPLQRRLYELGYTEVGEADGVAGPAFDKATKRFQKENGRSVDGEFTKGQYSWKKILGMV